MTLFDQPDVFRLHLDSGGEVALFEVDNQALDLAAPLAHQSAFEAVETAADDADPFAVEEGRDFVEAVVFDDVVLLHRFDELLHGIIWYGQGLVLPAAVYVAELQILDLTDNGFELFPGLVYEEEVGHVGNGAYHPFAKLREHLLLEGHKHAILHFGHLLEYFIGGILGIRTCQIAQYVPGGCCCLHNDPRLCC